MPGARKYGQPKYDYGQCGEKLVYVEEWRLLALDNVVNAAQTLLDQWDDPSKNALEQALKVLYRSSLPPESDGGETADK